MSIEEAKLNTKAVLRNDKIVETVIKAVSFVSFALIILIFVFVFKEAAPVFFKATETAKPKAAPIVQETYGEEITGTLTDSSMAMNKPQATAAEEDPRASLKSLGGSEWQPVSSNPRYGLEPLLWGSFKVTVISLLVATPLSVLAALFTVVFAPKRIREIIKPAIELLAGFPSVVIGFFALTTIASFTQALFNTESRLNAFVGGLALAITVAPIIFTVTEDALNSIPSFMSEASLALGATKWQTAIHVLLPAATPGIFAAMLLGFGRAFGETMIVIMATGNASLNTMSFFDSVRTMSATIGAEMAEVVFGDIHYHILFLLGSILFVLTFFLNAIAEFYVRQRLLKKFRGG